MPIFDYKCRDCGHQFEKIVRAGDTPQCPSCQRSNLEQLVSIPAISTQKSRNHALGIARKQAGEIRKEQNHAQREYEANYVKEHS